MKISMGKKLLMLAHWLCSLLVCAALAVCLIAPGYIADGMEKLRGSVGQTGMWIIGIAALAVYAALAAAQLCAILGRRRKVEKGFITVDSTNTGHVRISIAAIEQMVRQSVHNIDGISEMKIGIEGLDDAIGISVNAVIVNGSHVPTITANMQRLIRQFVELNCGVPVQTVSISINAVSNQPEGVRHRFGKGKLSFAKPAFSKSQTEVGKNASGLFREAPESVKSEDEAAVQGRIPDAEPVEQTAFGEPEADAQPETIREQTAVYDFDKPYESQFEKDLAEMRSREADAEAGDGPGRDGD